MSAHRIEAAGVQLHAVLEGEGAPVLLLHGFTGSSQSMAAVSRGLQRRRQVISLDLVGHGASESPESLDHYRMEACVEQVAGALARLVAEPVHVLGYSMGGRVALALCATRPEIVRSALVVGASAGIADPALRAQRTLQDEALARRIEERGLEAFVDEWMALPLFASQARLGPKALAASREQRLRNRTHGLAQSLRGMGSGAQEPLHEALQALELPICFAVGDEDEKFRAIAEPLAAGQRSARVETIPGAGHAAHLENPEAFLALAARFFAEVEAARAPRHRACRAVHPA